MAPICPVGLKTTISNFVKKISAGGNKVNVLQETEKLLTSTGKKYVYEMDDELMRILRHKGGGEKRLTVIDCPGEQTQLVFQRNKGRENIFSTIMDYNGKCTKQFNDDAEQILFDILA